jgi:hypothetical protein
MGLRTVHVMLAACVLLSGCAGSKMARNPVWVSGSANGLQQSVCNCGGVETKKEFKKRRKAEWKAQQARSKGGNR